MSNMNPVKKFGMALHNEYITSLKGLTYIEIVWHIFSFLFSFMLDYQPFLHYVSNFPPFCPIIEHFFFLLIYVPMLIDTLSMVSYKNGISAPLFPNT